MTILELIRADADGIADRSGKTALDSQIEEWRSADVSAVAKALEQVVASLDKNDWKQWRALRQIIWRLNLKNEKLRDDLARISHTTEDWAPGKPILSDAGPAPRVFVAPKALYVGNFLDLRGSVSCARNDRAGAARVMPGRRGRWQRLRAGLRRVPNLARPGRPMPWRS